MKSKIMAATETAKKTILAEPTRAKKEAALILI
jgi:hypothetical protein